MKSETVDWAQVTEALGVLRQELTRLGERVAALEAATGVRPSTQTVKPSSERAAALQPLAEAEGVNEELLLIISAAIAAFLGKKAHVRQIHLVGTAAWTQQGRVTIQASHTLPVRHG